MTELSASSALPFNPATYSCMGHLGDGTFFSNSPLLPLPWKVVRYEAPVAVTEAKPAEESGGEELPGTVTLQGQVWDMATGEVLPTVALEVYQKQSDGRVLLAYTGRASTGSFTVPLIRGVTHILIFSCTGYQPEAYYVAAGTDDTERSFYLNRRPLTAETAVASTSVIETGRPFQDKASLPAYEEVPAEPETSDGAPSIGMIRIPSLMPKLADLQPMCDPPVERPAPALFVSELKKATSFREGPSHETAVLSRFQAGDEVEVLEKTDEFWWKVRFDGQEGFVKAFLLHKQ